MAISMTSMTNDAIGYKKGDWIVHCHFGVGLIENIEHKTIGDQANTYFRIKMTDSTIWIPVDQLNSDYVRPPARNTRFQEAIDVLQKPPKEMATNLSARKSRIKRVVVDNTPVETARLIRDLRGRRRRKRGLNQSERRALQKLTTRFVHEWAVCKGMTVKQADQRFNNKLDLRLATA